MSPPRDHIRRALLAKSPSAGNWRTLGCDLARVLCPSLSAGPPGLVAPGAAVALMEAIRDLLSATEGEGAWLASARFELAMGLAIRAQVQGRKRRRADLAAARAIADGLADLGYQDLAKSLRAACSMAALPRPILWLLGRVLGPVAKRFAGLILLVRAKALTPPDRNP